MIELLYDVIRATAGADITISAEIADDTGAPFTSGCTLKLQDDKELIAEIAGINKEGIWYFTIPAEMTKGLKGRYWYCLNHKSSSLCFKEPIYLI